MSTLWRLAPSTVPDDLRTIIVQTETLLRPAPFAAFPESQAACASGLSLLFQPDLKDARPQFPAQDKRFAVIGQTPALGIVVKLAKLLEAVPVIDKAAM